MEKSNKAGLLSPLMVLGVSAVLCGAQSASSGIVAANSKAFTASLKP